MKQLIVIENEVVEVTSIHEIDNYFMVECDNGCDYYIFEDRDEAGWAAREHWVDMQRHDVEEFKCIIGTDRLVQWACNESDSFGASSFEAFLDIVESVPEEEFAGYDHNEIEIGYLLNGQYKNVMNKNLRNELGYESYDHVVLYRNN